MPMVSAGAQTLDNVDHDHLLAMVRERVSDRKILHMLTAILRAGICAGDELLASDTGSPQGGVISPLLANVYLTGSTGTGRHIIAGSGNSCATQMIS